MHRNVIPLLITLAVLIGFFLAGIVYLRTVAPRLAKNHAVLNSTSDLRLALTLDYDRGPLVQERYTMRDDDGLSTTGYRAIGRNRVQITIAEHPSTAIDAETDVAFLFGRVVQDGLWDLPSRPPRGKADPRYTIAMYQLVDGQHGGRSFSFTDPHYWATTGGHQFTLHLDKNKPVPDLLRMSSTTLVEPRYEQLVADFLAFGPKSFRDRIASEKKRRYGIRPS